MHINPFSRKCLSNYFFLFRLIYQYFVLHLNPNFTWYCPSNFTVFLSYNSIHIYFAFLNRHIKRSLVFLRLMTFCFAKFLHQLYDFLVESFSASANISSGDQENLICSFFLIHFHCMIQAGFNCVAQRSNPSASVSQGWDICHSVWLWLVLNLCIFFFFFISA